MEATSAFNSLRHLSRESSLPSRRKRALVRTILKLFLSRRLLFKVDWCDEPGLLCADGGESGQGRGVSDREVKPEARFLNILGTS